MPVASAAQVRWEGKVVGTLSVGSFDKEVLGSWDGRSRASSLPVDVISIEQ